MLIVKILLIIGASAAGIALIVAAVRTGKPFRTLLSSAFGGVVSLIVISVTGTITGAMLAINAWTLICAAACGIPGVLFMLAVKMIWGV